MKLANRPTFLANVYRVSSILNAAKTPRFLCHFVFVVHFKLTKWFIWCVSCITRLSTNITAPQLSHKNICRYFRKQIMRSESHLPPLLHSFKKLIWLKYSCFSPTTFPFPSNKRRLETSWEEQGLHLIIINLENVDHENLKIITLCQNLALLLTLYRQVYWTCSTTRGNEESNLKDS